MENNEYTLNNNFIVELDLLHGHLKCLVFAEVEFLNLESTITFDKPDWLTYALKRIHNTLLDKYTKAYI